MVKLSKAPEISAGRIWGKSTSRIACISLAPKSRAASSISRLKVARRARTTTVTKGKQKVMWAMMIAPRSSGQGRSRGQGKTLPKNTSMATPMQISGTTIGSVITPSNSPLPGKRNRQRVIPAIVPKTTETSVATKAMVSELVKASISASSSDSLTNQSVVKPSQRMVRGELLKLKTIRLTSGTYMKAKTAPTQMRIGQRRAYSKGPTGLRFWARLMADLPWRGRGLTAPR